MSKRDSKRKLIDYESDPESDEESNKQKKPLKKNGTDDRSRVCPYLDTINRGLLDFDFEKLCSVSLSKINCYACLVCGKYFQGLYITTNINPFEILNVFIVEVVVSELMHTCIRCLSDITCFSIYIL